MGYIYGCIDWSDGGTIKFDKSAFVCTGTSKLDACIEWTGAHAGQIKLVVTNAAKSECEDTFYGCIDWSNDGKFKILIPSTCCTGYCSYCCTAEDECDGTPQYLTVTISGMWAGAMECGVIPCIPTESSAWNRDAPAVTAEEFGSYKFLLTKNATNHCLWQWDEYPGGVDVGRTITSYNSTWDCSDGVTQESIISTVTVVRTATQTAFSYSSGGGYWGGSAQGLYYSPSSGCVSGSVSIPQTYICDGSYSITLGGGTATIEEGDQT